MMKKYLVWLLAAVLVATIIWILQGSDEQREILERLEQIRALAEVDEQETSLTRVSRAKQISSLFTPQTHYDLTTLELGVTVLTTRDELAQRIVAGRSKLQSLQLELLAPVVLVDGDHATVSLTGTAVGATPHGEGQFMDVHRVEIELVRTDGDWLVSGGRHIRDERAAFSK